MRTEIKEKRTVSQKHFQNEDGSKTLKSHVGHIHYFNKKEVGDGKAGFRSIDMQLEWNESKKGWEFLYHSFNPFIPEYANDWADFRDLYDDKDQTISYLPKCKRVLGRLVESIEGVTETNAVIYDNAFGEGFDLIYYFSRTQMKKVVRIRDKFKPTTDISFDFGIKFSDPTMKVIRSFDDKHEYELDISKPKTFDSARQTKIQKRNITNDKLENNTFLKEFKCWDSGTVEDGGVVEEIIEVDLLVDQTGVTFRKKLTADFLNKSNGDVFTDTTTTYTSASGDGLVLSQLTTGWNNTHNATTGTVSNGGTKQHNHYWTDGSIIQIHRLFYAFDTSGIGDTDVISAAELTIKARTYNTLGTPDKMVLVEATQASTSTLSAGDFDNVTENELAPRKDSADWGDDSTERVSTFVLDDFTTIDKTGYTKMATRFGQDVDDTQPSVINAGLLNVSMSESADDPSFEVTYAAGGGGGGFVPTPMLQMLQVTGGII